MNLQLYAKVSPLFKYDLDPKVLHDLAVTEGPSRFREISRRLHRAMYVDDGTLNKSLKRLIRQRLIVRNVTREGRARVPIYEITSRGLSRLRLYEVIFNAYDTYTTDTPNTDLTEQ